ncbi:hypothetical protein B296_00054771 [Ensete ventricosum]|uniref:Uncharacterized protein n=1 Tax=Ensete ventricosum TaxID=4639 RepID=A0A426XBK1_ENSVE|nr:hypothetical protein B296_00054771 [Ensete ventricosum]
MPVRSVPLVECDGTGLFPPCYRLKQVGNSRFRPSPPGCGWGRLRPENLGTTLQTRRTLRGDDFFAAVFSSSEVMRKRGYQGFS